MDAEIQQRGLFPVNVDARFIERPGADPIKLSAAQFAIFATLNNARGEWVPRDRLLTVLANGRSLRGPQNVGDEQQILRVQVCFLRKRIECLASIEGKHGTGYRLVSLSK